MPLEQRKADDLYNLVGEIANNPFLLYSKDGLDTTIRAIRTELYNHDLRQVIHPYINELTDTITVPFADVRFLATILGIELTDVLLGQYSGWTHPLDPSWGMELRAGLVKRRKKQHNKELIKQKLLTLMQDNPSLSLRHAARTLNVSVGLIRYRYPSIAHRITKSFRQFQRSKQFEMKILAREHAIRYFVNLGDEFWSKKGAFRSIRRETKLPKNLLRREIAEVYSELISRQLKVG